MNRRQWLLLLVRIAVSVVLLALIINRVDLPQTIRLLGSVQPGLAILGLLCGVVGVVVSSAQWQVLLRAAGVVVPLRLLTGLYFLGYTFSQLLPTTIGGDAVKAAYVARLSGKTSGSIGATIMARVVGFAVLLATGLPISLAASAFVTGFGWSPTILLVVVAVAFTATLLLFTRLRRWLGRTSLHRSRWGSAVLDLTGELATSLAQRSTLSRALLLSLLFYASLDLTYFFYGKALGLQAALWFYCVAVPVLSIITLLPISLNGYGLREGAVIVLFKLAGDTSAAALSLALVIEVQLLLFALVGVLVLLAVRREQAVIDR